MEDEQIICVKLIMYLLHLLQHLNTAAAPFNTVDCTEHYSSTRTEGLKDVINLSARSHKHGNINCWWQSYKPR